MLKEERFGHILTKLKSTDRVLFEELAIELGVSEDTIRRDIELLSRSGLLVKVRGGAISPAVNPLSFHDRAERFTDGKQRIALKAQQLLRNAQTVFMDGGTTMVAVAACLPIEARLRIITNNLALIPILSAHQGVELIVLGGAYNRVTKTNTGSQTCQQAQLYYADVYLMGACSIDSATGVTASIQEEGDTKRVMLASARQTAVLSNQEKLGTVDYVKVTDLSAIDVLVTDLASDDRRLDAYRFSNLEIM